ncbi:acyl-CoA dehydrogenase family protein [Sphingomonas oligophenolica]|uniref:Acyl-CoA dehydrogenase family protein n=1 Tax=Sphingomonas oligophenolica TaxID=301154 RepID=A0ABU9YBE2_9SPHN
MNEQQTMLSDMTQALFGELGHKTTLAEAWPRVEELSLPDLLVDDAHGGFGGSWQDALIVFRAAGYHALGLPLVESVLAAHLGSRHGFQGRGTIARAANGTISGDQFEGTLEDVIVSDGAAFVVAPFEKGSSLIVELPASAARRATTISGEARDQVTICHGRAVTQDVDIFALGAFARSAQIAGALDAALAISTDYVNQRKQFGRNLSAFQAVQQNLATFACEAAAANCAASAAAQALDRGNGTFEIGAAKLRCNIAVGTGAGIAHQVHGAIGFTEEYGLHPLTRRLWTWRSEFGNDSHWATRLGGQLCARGADSFWPDLTALTD